MKVLMVGAGGKYAHYVLPELKKRGATVKALVRSDENQDEVMSRGADEVAIGDLNDEQSSRSAEQNSFASPIG